MSTHGSMTRYPCRLTSIIKTEESIAGPPEQARGVFDADQRRRLVEAGRAMQQQEVEGGSQIA